MGRCAHSALCYALWSRVNASAERRIHRIGLSVMGLEFAPFGRVVVSFIS